MAAWLKPIACPFLLSGTSEIRGAGVLELEIERHIEVSQLWMRDKVRTGQIMIREIDDTKENIADALTKFVTQEEFNGHL